MKPVSLLVSLILIAGSAYSQTFSQQELTDIAKEYTQASFPMLKDLLATANDANYPEHVEANVAWCLRAFGDRGFTTQRIETGAVPLLLAERKVKKAEKTVLLYMHMDGQPVDTARWQQENPYKPVLKKLSKNGGWEEIPWSSLDNFEDDWRIFSRSASDDKGPIAMLLAALDAIDDHKKKPYFNIKVILDFEEEQGSPHLPQAVKDNKELLAADMLVIFDGPRHITNKPTLSFGARGIATIQLTTYGPILPQHSGHFGNYAPNPALQLSQLLASMKDTDGRVIIPGYYDGISIDAATEKILKAVPDDESAIRGRLQMGSVDKVGRYYQEALQYPSLNIRGMQSGWINEKVRTIVPAWARAEIDVRLVMESDPERLIGLVRKHIEDQGYFVMDHTPSKEERLAHAKVVTFTYEISYGAFRTPFDSDEGRWLRSAMQHAFGEDPVMIRTSGGSVPISPFVNTLGIPAVTVPTVNRDNNQHSPNENLRLGNYREGIQAIIAILTERLE